MGHLLPPAGIDNVQKGDVFRFYKVLPGGDDDCSPCDAIPLNIHDFKWTDYEEENRLCREQRKAEEEEARAPKRHKGQCPPNCPCQSSRGYRAPGSAGFSPHPAGSPWGSRDGAHHHRHGSWGCCPPINVDYRDLIRPRNKDISDSSRPTGHPYFAQERKPSCTPSQAPLATKGGFSFNDWLRTIEDRVPPATLKERLCVPSLCTWCQPSYINCCPDYHDPHAYTITKQGG